MNATPIFHLASAADGTLSVSGAISFANAGAALRKGPQPARNAGVLDLDLAELKNADSASLAVLIAWSAAAQRQGASLRYRNAPQGLRNLAHLCDLEELLGLR